MVKVLILFRVAERCPCFVFIYRPSILTNLDWDGCNEEKMNSPDNVEKCPYFADVTRTKQSVRYAISLQNICSVIKLSTYVLQTAILELDIQLMRPLSGFLYPAP